MLDAIDRQILDLLQTDARMTNAAIAEAVGLTAPAVFERIRKLEQRNVILGYTVRLNPEALGRPLTAFTRLTVDYDERYEDGLQALHDDPEVLECYHVAGEDCFILKTRLANPAALEALLGRIRRRMTISRSVSMIALSAVKEGDRLDVCAELPVESATKHPAARAKAKTLKEKTQKKG